MARVGTKLAWYTNLGIAVLMLSPWMQQRMVGQAHGLLAGPSASAGAVVPQSIRFSGVAANRAGDTVEAEFGIYATPEGGEPLWTETQRIVIGADGRYSVLLGGATQSGMPSAVFGGGQARWVGVRIERGQEAARTPLISVPYAMKAADAQTLTGHQAAEFVTQGQLREATAALAETSPAITPASITGGGTSGALAYWTSSSALGSSAITQSGTAVKPLLGVNLAALTPISTIDVGGTVNARGNLSLNKNLTATATAAVPSPSLMFTANTFATGGTTANQNFSWRAAAVGNNTASPTGKLVFGAGTGTTTADTGLSIAPTGVITFAAAQKFPGAIASVSASAPLTATTTLGAVALGLNLGTLEASLNPLYARKDVANSFTGNQSITGNLTTSGLVQANGVNSQVPGTVTGSAAVIGTETAASGQVYGVSGSTTSTTGNAAGVYGNASATTGGADGVYGTSSSASGAGVYGLSSSGGGNGVLGFNDATSGRPVGVTGVAVFSSTGVGVNGVTGTGIGGLFDANPGGMVLEGDVQNGGTSTRIFSVDASGNGFFSGNLQVTGTMSKGGGSFKIDDPLDPEHRYLSHSFVESPDMMNVYNGNIVTDRNGYATVVLPEYFEALNRDFRYQLTVMGQFAQAIVAKKIAKNRFVIRTNKPKVEVSWQVTGIRHDLWANSHRIPVEEEKPASEQGHYLHPELFGTGIDKNVGGGR